MLLWPTVPVFALLQENLEISAPTTALIPLVLVLVTTLLGWALLHSLVRDARRSALAASVLAFVFLSQSDLSAVAERLHLPTRLLVGPIQPLLLAGFILQSRRRLESWTSFANAFALVTAFFLAWPVGASLFQRWHSPTNVYAAVALPAKHDQPRPDVYIVIVDGYSREDVLRDYFGLESGLTPHLRSLGFVVPSHAASNYAQTAQSVASMLNLEYLPTLLERQPNDVYPRWRFADYISRNRVFRTFTAAGYRIRTYESEYGLVRPQEVAERSKPAFSVTEFDLALYSQSIGPLFSVFAGQTRAALMQTLHRRQVLWTLERLETDLPRDEDPPTLTFAHLQIPHPPFLFEADGGPLRSEMPAGIHDGNHWKDAATLLELDESYEAGYAKAVRYLDTRLARITSRVTADQRRPTIMYLLGDHGSGSRLNWDDATKTDFRERLGILLAIKFHRQPSAAVPPDITPVNAMRMVLNSALGTTLKPLADRSYFSPWFEPTVFVDVTEAVH